MGEPNQALGGGQLLNSTNEFVLLKLTITCGSVPTVGSYGLTGGWLVWVHRGSLPASQNGNGLQQLNEISPQTKGAKFEGIPSLDLAPSLNPGQSITGYIMYAVPRQPGYLMMNEATVPGAVGQAKNLFGQQVIDSMNIMY